ncbi:ribonuclease P protein component [Buchnera aphidicola (Mollitrichosiphum nigrofasciatum)]|uniref:ribonuclease P protein component n=1 Tax=Buchnera aphidicola TaxID=9 RepID=UPI0031B855CB
MIFENSNSLVKNTFSLQKKKKIINLVEFDYVFQQPKIVKNLYFTLFSRKNFLNYSRLGILVNKKNIKYAYCRNYIKRIIKEKFRIYQHQLLFLDFIIVVKKIIVFKKKKFIKNLEELWFFSYNFLLD